MIRIFQREREKSFHNSNILREDIFVFLHYVIILSTNFRSSNFKSLALESLE